MLLKHSLTELQRGSGICENRRRRKNLPCQRNQDRGGDSISGNGAGTVVAFPTPTRPVANLRDNFQLRTSLPPLLGRRRCLGSVAAWLEEGRGPVPIQSPRRRMASPPVAGFSRRPLSLRPPRSRAAPDTRPARAYEWRRCTRTDPVRRRGSRTGRGRRDVCKLPPVVHASSIALSSARAVGTR
jgi:hypothetical protein